MILREIQYVEEYSNLSPTNFKNCKFYDFNASEYLIEQREILA